MDSKNLDDIKTNCQMCGAPVLGEDVCNRCKMDLTNEYEVFV